VPPPELVPDHGRTAVLQYCRWRIREARKIFQTEVNTQICTTRQSEPLWEP
jgi:hypothetical protein